MRVAPIDFFFPSSTKAAVKEEVIVLGLVYVEREREKLLHRADEGAAGVG